MFVTHLGNKFHTPSTNSSLIIVIKQKTKDVLGAVVFLFFYVVKKYCLGTKCKTFQSPLSYVTSRSKIKCSQCSSHLTSACVSQFLLQTVGKCLTIRIWSARQ